MRKFIVWCLLLLSLSSVSAQTRPDWLDIKNTPSVDPRRFGMSENATPIKNREALEAAFLQGSSIVIPDGVFEVSNTTGPLVLETKVAIHGTGTLKATSKDYDFIRVMADDCSFSNITIAGVGLNVASQTWKNEEDKLALLAIGASGSSLVKNCKVSGVNFVAPPIHSIQMFKAIGCKIERCNFYSDDGEVLITNPVYAQLAYLGHISLQTSANCTVRGNTLFGMVQGIMAGGNELDLFTSPDGVSSGYTRGHIVTNNKIEGVQDHGIYFSDVCREYIICENIVSATNDGIKIEGEKCVVANNKVAIRAGSILTGRNCKDVIISSNYGETSGTGPFSYGIFIGGTTSSTGFENITISNNQLVAINSGCADGIKVQGQAYGLIHNQIKNLVVSGNTIVGFGSDSTLPATLQAGVHVFQDYPIGVVASIPENLIITNNIIDLKSSATTPGKAGVIIRGGANYANVSFNTIKNYGAAFGQSAAAIYLHSVINSLISNNNSTVDSQSLGATSGYRELLPNVYGIAASYTEASLSVPANNTYSQNRVAGNNAPDILWLTSSSKATPKKVFNNANYNLNFTLHPYSAVDTFLFGSATGNRSIIATTTTGPFTQYDTIIVHNMSATATVYFNDDASSFSVSAGTTGEFMQIATGTYGDNLANTWIKLQ